jgi:hypothetical protein
MKWTENRYYFHNIVVSFANLKNIFFKGKRGYQRNGGSDPVNSAGHIRAGGPAHLPTRRGPSTHHACAQQPQCRKTITDGATQNMKQNL